MLQKVPKKFVEKYWKGVPNPAVITLPNGVQQQLFWVKRDGRRWRCIVSEELGENS
jgi:hypothetical protein